MIKQGQKIITTYTGEEYFLAGVQTVTSGAKKKTKKVFYQFSPGVNAKRGFTQTEQEFARMVSMGVFVINESN